MKTLFLVDGAAGTGKSDLLRHIHSRKPGTAIALSKYTTRDKRSEEVVHRVDLDLRFPPDTEEQFRDRTKESDFYWYMYGAKDLEEHYYGIYRAEIAKALEQKDIVFLIVRNVDVAGRIKRDFSRVQCVSVFMYTDRDRVENRLRNEGYSEEAIARRLDRQPLAWKDYIVNWRFYDDVIVNNSEHQDFESLIEGLIAKWHSRRAGRLWISAAEQFQLIEPLVGFHDRIVQRLDRFDYERNVFLMMKFREHNKHLHEIVRQPLAEHGLNCVRSDDPPWDITRNVYNPIAVLYGCKYGIALFDQPEARSAFSANVAYELGMMHEQGKECLVLISNKVKNVPFDFVKELYVLYKSDFELGEKVAEWVKKLKV